MHTLDILQAVTCICSRELRFNCLVQELEGDRWQWVLISVNDHKSSNTPTDACFCCQGRKPRARRSVCC